jgi:poly(A) polymerase
MGEPDAARALEALEIAAISSENARIECPIIVVGPDDVRAATSTALADFRSLLDRVLLGFDPEVGLDVLLDSGILGSILPEVSALVDFGDGEWRHKDVWKHTKQVVLQAEPKVDLRWAAMLHDIGKVRTRSISPDGEVHFFGHAEVGARMFDKIERRVGLFRNEESLRVTVRFLILHHLRANQYERSWTDSAVRRFAKDLGSELQNLLCLARADITTKRPEKKRRGLQQIDELAKRIAELAEQDAIVPPLPSGIGNLIMETFRIPPSKLIGNVKVALEQAVDSGDLPSHQPSEFYVEYLKENAERFGLPKIA